MRRTRSLALISLGSLLLLGSLLVSCGAPKGAIDLGLGKVVVYRSGVAYFERRVRPDADRITIAVPVDLVDDFLKSMTVRDLGTGKTLPITLPSRSTARNGLVDIDVALPGPPYPDQVAISYLTEAPAWKPSYRVRVGADGAIRLEGWAVVDNTSGETWRDVVIGVGSSSALSFRYDLWSVRDVKRQVLGESESFAVAPPSGGAAHAEGEPLVVGELRDNDIAFPETHQNVVIGRSFQSSLIDPGGSSGDSVGVSFSGSSAIENSYVVEGVNTSGHSYARTPTEAERAAAQRAIRERAEAQRQRERSHRLAEKLAARLKAGGHAVVIEGYASTGEADPRSASLDRANVMRNQLIELGVAPAQLEVRPMGARDGRPAGVRVVAAGAAPGKAADAPSDPVGESHFSARTPMTVEAGKSVMLSIVSGPVDGELVYLYDADSARGNTRFAFRAVRMTNPTENTLEPGPVTVYGAGRFIGEGLTEPIGPGAVAMVPFALDRQIAVDRVLDRADRIAGLAKVERGVLTADIEHRRTTKLSLVNRLGRAATVYVRHQISRGWTLRDAPKRRERIGDAHLFAIELGANERKTVSIVETTPMTRRLDLRTVGAIDMLEVYLSGDAREDGKLAAALAPLLAIHRDIVDLHGEVDSLRARLGELRYRSAELTAQIVSLRAVRTRGQLVRYLQTKLAEISERVQRATLAIVDREQTLMLARLRFRDRLAELER